MSIRGTSGVSAPGAKDFLILDLLPKREPSTNPSRADTHIMYRFKPDAKIKVWYTVTSSHKLKLKGFLLQARMDLRKQVPADSSLLSLQCRLSGTARPFSMFMLLFSIAKPAASLQRSVWI